MERRGADSFTADWRRWTRRERVAAIVLVAVSLALAVMYYHLAG
jgi:hypothetical protein